MNEREKLFKCEMILYGDDLTTLSKYLSITRQTLARKIREGTFTQEEMTKIKIRYKLSDEKFSELFIKKELVK